MALRIPKRREDNPKGRTLTELGSGRVTAQRNLNVSSYMPIILRYFVQWTARVVVISPIGGASK